MCPTVAAPPIDAAGNTRTPTREGIYNYFAGRSYPQFGNTARVPDALHKLGSNQVIWQDTLTRVPGNWYYNHGNTNRKNNEPTNPSKAFYISPYRPEGINAAFGDGHASFIVFRKLVDVGLRSSGSAGRTIYSVLP